ncbi:MAG TPA: toll/interleukin-1 receptor domain-containing protein [Thermoanaerobaculia bacterium]|nr:toll/interleukin-1 receptor domain-containing protein [Thermoanaerobaculia bacterium]
MAKVPHFFISYKRSDQEGKYLAHMISRELRRRYGPDSAFLDVASRSPGLSFRAKLDRALKVTDVVLVIIGPLWLQRLTERIGDPWDWVRYEISESLKRDSLSVVPICRAGVAMPCPHELPEEIRGLCLRDTVPFDPFQDLEAQLVRLLNGLETRVAALHGRELQFAREKLIALLRWRARQLELAAVRDADTAQAAEWTDARTKMPCFFISYMRSDQEGQYLAHMISGELRRRYGPASALLGIDSRIPGLSFRAKVDRVLKVTDNVLVIIGPSWLQRLTERVRDPWDWVRYEISESLKRKPLPVVPVLLAGVEMPQSHELPEELQDLGERDAVPIDPFQDFETHLTSLLSDLESMRQQKEELQAARGKLTDLLRLRIRQRKLAAVRHAAARREAKRAAQERAEAAVREVLPALQSLHERRGGLELPCQWTGDLRTRLRLFLQPLGPSFCAGELSPDILIRPVLQRGHGSEPSLV